MASTTRFDAVAFLGSLLEPETDQAVTFDDEPTDWVSSDVAIQPGDLPESWRELYEERAAIREFDGGQAREHAEAEALREIVARMRSN